MNYYLTESSESHVFIHYFPQFSIFIIENFLTSSSFWNLFSTAFVYIIRRRRRKKNVSFPFDIQSANFSSVHRFDYRVHFAFMFEKSRLCIVYRPQRNYFLYLRFLSHSNEIDIVSPFSQIDFFFRSVLFVCLIDAH